MLWFVHLTCQWKVVIKLKKGYPFTVNSRLADTPLLQALAITENIQIPIYKSLTENDSRY